MTDPEQPEPAGDDVDPQDSGSDTAEQPVFRQELLPQEVQPARRRTALLITLGVVVLVVVGVGVVLWLVNRGDGGDRSAYCETLRAATNDGDLAGALGSTDPAVVDQLADEAPDAVADDWVLLVQLRDTFTQGGQPKASDALAALSALQHIVSDADSECDLTIDLPLP
jgi:hypothetical protein